MSDAIAAISRSLTADIESLRAVSQNVANVATPGYQALTSRLDFAGMTAQTSRSREDGALQQTGRSLDLALRGPGYFMTEKKGVRWLVRAGSFTRAADGTLRTRDGASVLSDAGSALSLPEGDVRIDAAGVIWSGTQQAGRIGLVDVTDAAGLNSGDFGYRYEGSYTEWHGEMVQGAVELSNVDAADQTVQIIELTRHAESVQRVISAYDRMLDTGVNRLGDN
ncbi:MAG TPA: flagellar basal body rod C-terminal domain-containing protein [Stenotrophomonas sp.]|nr:flagellar basal body rod C-terminal domain-containing protein [Stenotrophomonas sp.]